MPKSLILVAGTLLLIGAGCARTADTIANEAVQPLEVSVDALKKTQELAAQQEAKTNEENERESPDITVALIRTNPGNGTTPVADAVGCGDQIAFVQFHRAATSGNTLKDAVTTLLSLRESAHDGSYNALWQSSLTVEDVRSMDGVTTDVLLKGKVVSAGACDDPRIKAQIERTVARFKPKYRIILNGSEANWRCLGDQSGECK